MSDFWFPVVSLAIYIFYQPVFLHAFEPGGGGFRFDAHLSGFLQERGPCEFFFHAVYQRIPVGIAASRVGRRRTILFGVLLLTACFGSGYFYTLFNNTFHPALYALFALVGVAWASINVNSLPMVVEMCRGSDVGKFTGYYYTASMAAQTITPIVAGWLLKHVSYSVLFLYSAIFVGLAFFTMLMVRHGDVKVEAKRGLEAFDVDD
jgi:maltose/moltooligosaccharide transporter